MPILKDAKVEHGARTNAPDAEPMRMPATPGREQPRNDDRARPFRERERRPSDGTDAEGLTDILFKRPPPDADSGKLAKVEKAGEEAAKLDPQRRQPDPAAPPRPAHLRDADEVLMVGGVPVDATVLVTQTTVTVTNDPFNGVTISIDMLFAQGNLTAEEIRQLLTLTATKEDPDKLIGNKTDRGQELAAGLLQASQRMADDEAAKPKSEINARQLKELQDTVALVRRTLEPLKVIGGALDKFLAGTESRLAGQVARAEAAEKAAKEAAQIKAMTGKVSIRRDDAFGVFETARGVEADLVAANHHLRVRDALKPGEKTASELVDGVVKAASAARDAKAAADLAGVKHIAGIAAGMRMSTDLTVLRSGVEFVQEALNRIGGSEISAADKAALIKDLLDTLGDIKSALVRLMKAPEKASDEIVAQVAAKSEFKVPSRVVRMSATDRVYEPPTSRASN